MPPRSAALTRRVLAVLATVALTVTVAPAAVAAAPAGDAGAATEGSLAAAVPRVMAFVEKSRGLRFLRPVKVTALTAAQLERRVLAGSGRPRPPSDTGQTYAALHLVDSAKAYDDGAAKASAAGVLGFYVPGRDELVVRAVRATPFARGVLAHELTHALQDQHFDLQAVQRRATDADRFQGVASLYEGDADTVEERYRLSLSAADRGAYARELRGLGGLGGGTSGDAASREAQAVGAFLDFPYVYGPDLVAALRTAGGQALLDRAFADPPQSSEQVVDPARYALGGGRRDSPRRVGTPGRPAGTRVADTGVLGAYGLAVVLSSRVDGATRTRAALGWGGDRFVTWTTARGSCTRLRVVLDSGRDRAELLAALQTWARGYPGTGTGAVADPRDGKALTLTSCT